MHDTSAKTLPKALQEALSCVGQSLALEPLHCVLDEHAHCHHPIIATLSHPMSCAVVGQAFVVAPLGYEQPLNGAVAVAI